MSTLLHFVSFPFWFFGGLGMISACSNQIRLTFEGGYSRKATPLERTFVGTVSGVPLAIGFIMIIS